VTPIGGLARSFRILVAGRKGRPSLVDFCEPDFLYGASARAIEIASLSDAIRHLRMSQKAAVSEPKSGQNAPIKPRDESDESRISRRFAPDLLRGSG
jgi:hypothetical protein